MKMKPRLSAALALSITLLSGINLGHAAAGSDSSKANAAAMATMMKDMQPATGKPDFDFLTGMVPHHEGAVAMAKVEKQFGKDPVLLKLADSIIASQSGEITLMKGWLSNKKLQDAKAVPEAKKMSGVGMDKMMNDMMAPPTGKADVDFVKGMIPHHQGAIDMAKVEIQFGTDTDAKALSENIVKAQTGEISFMKDWLATHAK